MRYNSRCLFFQSKLEVYTCDHCDIDGLTCTTPLSRYFSQFTVPLESFLQHTHSEFLALVLTSFSPCLSCYLPRNTMYLAIFSLILGHIYSEISTFKVPWIFYYFFLQSRNFTWLGISCVSLQGIPVVYSSFFWVSSSPWFFGWLV